MSINETGYDEANGVGYYSHLPKVLRLNMSRTFQAGISLVKDKAKNTFNDMANFLQRLKLAMPDPNMTGDEVNWAGDFEYSLSRYDRPSPELSLA